jgi:hypothetical protein
MGSAAVPRSLAAHCRRVVVAGPGGDLAADCCNIACAMGWKIEPRYIGMFDILGSGRFLSSTAPPG